jgi:predicted RNase H-like HicB family nuclease
MSELVFEVTAEEDGGFSAKAIGHGIFTQGDTWEELREMALDAVKCHFDEGQVQASIRLHLLHEEVLAVA